METIETEVNTAVLNAPEDGLARVSLALRTAVDKLLSDPRMIRIIFVEALGKGGRVSSRRNAILRRAVETADDGGDLMKAHPTVVRRNPE